jgi:hypothetical protein
VLNVQEPFNLTDHALLQAAFSAILKAVPNENGYNSALSSNTINNARKRRWEELLSIAKLPK